MIVKYAPGSLVTRHRPALAASRLIAPYQVPVVVVTNGKDTNILDGSTGKVTGYGFEIDGFVKSPFYALRVKNAKNQKP